MKEYLYSIGMKDRRTDEKIELRVWGKNVDEATHKVTNGLFGAYGEYTWTGSGPLYENNQLIEREAR